MIKWWRTRERILINRLSDLDKTDDQGRCNEEISNERSKLLKEIRDLNSFTSLDIAQKANIHWAIKGDENSKYFHRIIIKKRSQLAICGVLLEGDWIVEPSNMKKEFLNHFANRFSKLVTHRLIFETQFPNRLSSNQIGDLERNVSYDEIKRAVWDCGINRSLGPYGFIFEFFHKYWNLIDQDVDLVSDVQSAFASNRQILDGPFILNKLLSWLVSAAKSMGCLSLSTPFNYLGVKVGSIMSRHSSWDDVIANITSRLSKWKLKTLFIGDRLTLIKSVLSSLPLYHLSIFKVPKVGNGESTSFWDDVWLDDSPLKHLYPRLYSLELDKHYSVAAKLWDSTLISSFRRAPRGGIEEEQLQLLVASTSSIVLPQISNRWVWSIVVESTLHLLFSCQLARQLMLKVTRWWELEIHECLSYCD
ncbi:hypothetical protein Tco_1314975 [Tanacetum coccineum]